MIKVLNVYLFVFIVLFILSYCISTNVNISIDINDHIFKWKNDSGYLIYLITFIIGSIINLYYYRFN